MYTEYFSCYDFVPESRFSPKTNLNSIIIRSKTQLKLTYLNDKLHSTRDTYDKTNVTVVVFGKYSLLLLIMSVLLLWLLLLSLLSLLFKPILMIISKNAVPYSVLSDVSVCVTKIRPAFRIHNQDFESESSRDEIFAKIII